MGDGSVKFVKDSIALPTWWALGTKANGEVISADSYLVEARPMADGHSSPQ